MLAVLLGSLAAFSWGSADVLARTTSRALGAQGALLFMMLTGLLGLSLWLGFGEARWPGWPGGWTLLSAILAALAMLLFYEAMKRGPVSMVSPVVGAYPAWIVAYNLLGGMPATPALLTAMGVTMAGVVLVARTAPAEPDPEENPHRAATLALAFLSSLVFAVSLQTGQLAVAADGEAPVLWWSRLLGVGVMVVVLLLRRQPMRVTPSALGWTMLQGVLDSSGLVFVYAAGRGLDGALATVASSAFGVVTVLEARLLYRERIVPAQGLGILAVSSGVAALAWLAGRPI